MNKKIISLAILVGLFCVVGMVSAQIEDPLKGATFPQLLEKIIQGAAVIVESLAVIMIIFAGILYLTSGGSPERMNKAKTALVYAVAGIVIALSAQGIILAIKQITGV